MRVVGFVGASGTGKSHNATWVANEFQITLIVDDGLLIHKNKVIAGKSAKREQTRVAAVKCALFMEPDHAREVSEAIAQSEEEGLLILGTSDRMVEKIAKNLGLHSPDELLFIDQICSLDDIHKAVNTRMLQGKHVIPVPTMEIKKDFSGYFIDPLNFFRRAKGRRDAEKTVVRPTFSYLGKFSISDFAIYQLIEHGVKSVEGVAKLFRYRFDALSEGLLIDIEISVYYGYNAKEILRNIKNNVMNDIENDTGLNVHRFKANVRSLDFSKHDKKKPSSIGAN